MPPETIPKKSNLLKIIAVVLLVLILLGAGGLFWLYKIESTLAKNYQKSTGSNIQNGIGNLNGATAPAKSWADEFMERIKLLYNGATGNNTKSSDKTKSGGTSTQSTGGGSGTATSGAGLGQPGPLDTDVPWREEGEPDLDYSYQEVRACGAVIKGPPEISDDPEQFNQEYQEYLAWIDQDCRNAYAEAGKPYPF